jgi:hypothetical protein
MYRHELIITQSFNATCVKEMWWHFKSIQRTLNRHIRKGIMRDKLTSAVLELRVKEMVINVREGYGIV